MPTIEEVDSDENFSDPDDAPLEAPAAKAKPATARPKPSPAPSQPHLAPTNPFQAPFSLPASFPGQHGMKTVELEVYKEWATLYPIYLDAKRPSSSGGRRVNKSQALAWPQAEPMAHACGRLGFQTVFEPTKTHPKDWENPGRVKVLFAVNGKPVKASIKDKRALLREIAAILRPHQPVPPPATPSNPLRLPPIQLRYPANSPAISHGMLESALNGEGMGAMGGMLGNMLGGGGAQEPEEPMEKKKEVPKIMPKPRKVHMKKKR